MFHRLMHVFAGYQLPHSAGGTFSIGCRAALTELKLGRLLRNLHGPIKQKLKTARNIGVTTPPEVLKRAGGPRDPVGR